MSEKQKNTTKRERRSYHAPKLVEIGDVVQLTATGSTTEMADSLKTMM